MLRRIPFLKFSLAFIFGIILANTFAINQLLPCYIALIAIATAYLLVHIYIKNSVASHTKSQWLGLMSMLFLMVAGYVLHAQSLPKHIVKHVGNFTNIQAVCGTVAQSVVNHEQYASVVLDCEKIYAQDKWQQCKGKLLVTILGNKQLAVPCGDRLIVRGNLQAILNKKTLGAFDLEKYFAHQNIYQKIIVEERQWAKYGVNSGYYLRRISEQCRHYCEQIIDKNITTPNEASISKALLLGVRTAVDKDLKQAYSNAGVIHVLAVSGLHVALLFILFQFFFKRWMIYPWGEKYLPYLFLLLLWAFAFLTGLSASVVRAVVMFSFLLLAQLLGKKSNTTNTVFVSAMAMLLYHTHYLFDVGFQLSYLAVLGIVWVHPWLVQKLTFKNIVFSTIWEATSITLAAQLATAPLCIYYFHRFPTYFLPANLLIVAITNGIMYCLVALMAFSAFVPVAKLLGMMVQYLLFFTNRLVLSIDQLPMSIIQFINMNVAQTILLYLFLWVYCC